jgi:nucleoside-diphosphate-sugar epimerase
VTTLIIGCGYLGQRVGALLGHRDEPVHGSVRSRERADAIAGLGIMPVVADVLQPGSLADLPAAERVFYCVGFDRSAGAAMRTVYLDGLQNVLDRLPRSVARFVYASSTGVYGQTGGEWVHEDSPAFPQHESGKLSLEAEERVRAWEKSRDGSATAIVLRFAGLYGPARVVRRALVERGENIPGDPDRFLNLIHIADAARAAAAALVTGSVEPTYVIGDDRPVTRREYYARVAEILGAPEPRFEARQAGNAEAVRDASNKRVANHRMKAGLGVTLEYPDITTGLPAAIGPSSRSLSPPAPAQRSNEAAPSTS